MVKIYSNEITIINELYKNLKENDIFVKRVLDDDERTIEDFANYIDVTKVSLTAISTIIAYLSYLLTRNRSYIYLKYKDGMELKLSNLSEEEKNKKLAKLKDTWENLIYIDIG